MKQLSEAFDIKKKNIYPDFSASIYSEDLILYRDDVLLLTTRGSRSAVPLQHLRVIDFTVSASGAGLFAGRRVGARLADDRLT